MLLNYPTLAAQTTLFSVGSAGCVEFLLMLNGCVDYTTLIHAFNEKALIGNSIRKGLNGTCDKTIFAAEFAVMLKHLL